MLPILRIFPVGGVLLAILILVLALKTPGVRPLPPDMIEARGPLLNLHEHPEWRQVLKRAAIRRADELIQLRELTDAPAQTSKPVGETPATALGDKTLPQEKPVAKATESPADEASQAGSKVANLPGELSDSAVDLDITGSIEEAPTATMPVEIGAASAFELPVMLPEERPAIIRTPEQVKPPTESQRKRTRRKSRPKTPLPPPKPDPLLSFLELLFRGASLPATGNGNQPVVQ